MAKYSSTAVEDSTLALSGIPRFQAIAHRTCGALFVSQQRVLHILGALEQEDRGIR